MPGGPRFRRKCAASCRCSRGTSTQPHRCLLSLGVSFLADIASRQYPGGPHVRREYACACGVYRGIATRFHGAPTWGADSTAPPSDKQRKAIDCGTMQYFQRVCWFWKTSFVSRSAPEYYLSDVQSDDRLLVNIRKRHRTSIGQRRLLRWA